MSCPGHHRHWFSAYGFPGISWPTCSRCGAPNPKWNDELQAAFDASEIATLPAFSRPSGAEEEEGR